MFSTRPWPIALDLGEPGFRALLGRLGAPAVAGDEAAVRAGADAGIFAVAPVDEVVPASRRPAGRGWRPRRPAGRAASADLLRRVEQRARPGLRRAAPACRRRCSRSKMRVGLDGELVEREMLAGHRRSPRRSSARQAASLWPGRRIDQVEGVAREDRRGDAAPPRAPRRRCAGGPSAFEVGVVERLHADRERG